MNLKENWILDGIYDFVENLKENSNVSEPEYTGTEVVDTGTGEVIEFTDSNEKISISKPEYEMPILEYVKIIGKAENIAAFIKSAEKFNIDVEILEPLKA